MADVHSKEVRSYNMSRIKSKNTKPEMLVRKFLHAHGFRYRLHYKRLPGKPDIVLSKLKITIFIHGCFWHGHKGCRYFTIPKTRTGWWLQKFEDNNRKDMENEERLNELGWKIILLWECDLRKDKKDESLNRLLEEIKKH